MYRAPLKPPPLYPPLPIPNGRRKEGGKREKREIDRKRGAKSQKGSGNRTIFKSTHRSHPTFFPLPQKRNGRKGGRRRKSCATRGKKPISGEKIATAAGRTRRICARRCAVAPAVARNAAREEEEPTTGIHPPTAICTCQTKRTRARDLSPTDLTPLLCSFYGRDYGVRWRALSQKLVAPRLAHWNTSRLSRQVGRRVTVNRLSNAKLGVRSLSPLRFRFDSAGWSRSPDLEEGNDAVDLIFFQRSWILRNELLGKRVFLPLSFYSKRVTSSLDDKLNVDRIFHFSFDIIIIPGRGRAWKRTIMAAR